MCLWGSVFLYLSVTFEFVKFRSRVSEFQQEGKRTVCLFILSLPKVFGNTFGIAASAGESLRRQKICILENYLPNAAEEPDLV